MMKNAVLMTSIMTPGQSLNVITKSFSIDDEDEEDDDNNDNNNDANHDDDKGEDEEES